MTTNCFLKSIVVQMGLRLVGKVWNVLHSRPSDVFGCIMRAMLRKGSVSPRKGLAQPLLPREVVHKHCGDDNSIQLSNLVKTWLYQASSFHVQFGRNYVLFLLFKTICGLTFNSFTRKISSITLLTACHTILIMIILRIWYWIN